jgi:hypothetical protein
MQPVPKKKSPSGLPHFDVPPWQALQEKVLGTINDFSEENPHVPNALLLTGTGLAYVTFATTRYGSEAFQYVYENVRSIVELFQSIIDDERKHIPKSTIGNVKDTKKMLEQKWMLLESIREKVNGLVEQEIKRLKESEEKPN